MKNLIKQHLINDFCSIPAYYYASKTKTKKDQVCEKTTFTIYFASNTSQLKRKIREPKTGSNEAFIAVAQEVNED